MQVLNLVKEVEVEPDSSTAGSSFHFKALGGLRTRSAVRGLGVLYFYWTGGVWTPRPQWNKSLLIPHPISYNEGVSSKTSEPSVSLNFPDKFSCAGAVSPELGGFLVAPTIKLDVAEGKDIAAMLISPRTSPIRVSLWKTSLSIPADGSGAKVDLSTNGGLACEGTVSSGGLSARLLLTRNSSPAITGLELAEELSELKQPGNITAKWKPVRRSFEELLFVFRPLDVNLGDLDELVEHVGADTETFDEAGPKPFIVGDGPEARYTLKLVVKKHLRSDSVDETSLAVT